MKELTTVQEVIDWLPTEEPHGKISNILKLHGVVEAAWDVISTGSWESDEQVTDNDRFGIRLRIATANPKADVIGSFGMDLPVTKENVIEAFKVTIQKAVEDIQAGRIT